MPFMSTKPRPEPKRNDLEAPNRALREYRYLITSAGQASPPRLGKKVVRLLKKQFSRNFSDRLSVIDIGCGLGHQMRLIAKSLPNLFSNIEGIDWSPATVEKHNSDPQTIYDRVTLCHSGELPFKDKEFDVALSMENLEHLYSNESIAAIKEMTRIAKYVVITTPIPHDCIHLRWLYGELIEAINDPIPLTERDFTCLESAVHKSTIFPASMKKAGFSIEAKSHGIYFGESKNIDPQFIECVGMEPEDIAAHRAKNESGADFDLKWIYVATLGKSLKLNDTIAQHPLYTPSAITKLKRWIRRTGP